ncbi:MAG: S41 family peptidase [Clostridia bacterium]|nr:S41 family peptidase [Clostridia bacterium]
MKTKKITALLTAIIILFVSGFTALAEENPMDKVIEYSNGMQKQMVKMYAHEIADTFYYGIDDDELLFSIICRTIEEGSFNINSAVEAMIEALDDKYSEFYTKEEYQAMTEDVSGEFSGIGVTILENSHGIVVLSVLENSPALSAGIMEGDYIISVDSKSTADLNASQVRSMIVGANGTPVTVGIRRGDRELELVCTRATVEVSQISTKQLTDDIAYLRLIQFTSGSVDEVKKYVSELKKNNIHKLVLDLRNNPGGELNAAVDIAKIFISAGLLGELKYKDERMNQKVYSRNYNAPDIRIALLVNENSASAAEFLTMAFQGRKAAKVFGTQTYGKGSMQILSSIPTGAGMKYTIGEFYTAAGKRVHTVGLTPDVIVENTVTAVDESQFENIDLDKVNEGGTDGKMTLALEQRLSVLGYFDEAPDEVFDASTAEAVKQLQYVLGNEATGIPGFYEYLYIKDHNYDFDLVDDLQLEAATEYLSGLR